MTSSFSPYPSTQSRNSILVSHRQLILVLSSYSLSILIFDYCSRRSAWVMYVEYRIWVCWRWVSFLCVQFQLFLQSQPCHLTCLYVFACSVCRKGIRCLNVYGIWCGCLQMSSVTNCQGKARVLCICRCLQMSSVCRKGIHLCHRVNLLSNSHIQWICS